MAHEHVFKSGGFKLGSVVINQIKTVITTTVGAAVDTALATEKAIVDYVTNAKVNTAENIAQASHGFTVGTVLRYDSGTSAWVKAQADTADHSEALGVVSSVIDSGNFTIAFKGKVTGLTGLTAGSVYFLSDGTAGLLTTTRPSSDGTVVKPMLFAISSTVGYVLNYLGIASNVTVFSTTLNANTTVVADSFADTVGTSGNWYYSIVSSDGTAVRSGWVTASWNPANDATAPEYTELGDKSIGDTSAIVLSVANSSSTIQLNAQNTASGTGWIVKAKRTVL